MRASVSDWEAAMDGTGRPPSPKWKPARSVENPRAPPFMASATAAFIWSTSVEVASRS